MSVDLTRESDRSHVAHLRIDFDDLNLFTEAAAHELRTAIDSISGDVSVVTIAADRTEGDEDGVRGLTAGLNLEWARDLSPHDGRELLQTLYRTIQSIRELDAVVVCGCGDYAIGAGLELAMACEFRVATEDARLGLPEIDVGLPTVIHGGLLIPLVGLQAATELIYTGETVSGFEAHELGLVNRAVPASAYDETFEDLIDTLAAKSPLVMQLQTQVMRRFRDQGLEAGMAATSSDIARSFGTHDQQEAMDAFLEDREPTFEGR